MSGWLTRDPAHFGSLEIAANAEGEEINANWMSRLVRVPDGADSWYVKTYFSRGRGLRGLAGRSRVRAEWENLQLFDSLEVPTAELVAWGENSLHGGAYRGALVTRGIAGARDLADIAADDGCTMLASQKWRKAVIRRLSRYVQRLHTAGFVHNDLKWRNILVQVEQSVADPPVYLIDCPLGRQFKGIAATLLAPYLARGRIKDLACLDKVARKVLSRTDRLRFYLAYKGQTRLLAENKKELKRVLKFFRGRD